jgi:DNA polymerase-4
MERLGILTGADLRAQSIDMLRANFRSSAEYLFNAARGVDNRPVRVNRASKSVGAERTFDRDYSDREDLVAQLDRVAEAAWVRIDRHRVRGRTVTLKMRYTDFHTITRARSFPSPVLDKARFLAAGIALLDTQLPVDSGIRLLGLTLSGITDEDEIEAVDQPALPL